MPGDHGERIPTATAAPPSRRDALDCVIETLLRVALTSAGATGAHLMLVRHGTLAPCARAHLEHDVIVEYETVSEPDSPVMAVARTVAEARQPVSLHTERAVERLCRTSGCRVRRPWSAFGIPLLHDARLLAVLVLEHDRLDKAFPGTRRALLEQLAPQMAAALANASPTRAPADTAPCHNPGEASRITAIGELVASIIHEISQPLSAIDASSGAAMRWLRRDEPNLREAIVSLESVQSCAVRAKAIIERLRTLNRQARIPFQAFDIHDAVREAVHTARPRIDGAGANVRFAGMHDARSVMGNRAQIQQVIEILIANALDAMDGVTDRARIIRISSLPRDDAPVISIADSGPGVSHELKETMFRPFVTTKPQGMGMGLCICKRIVEAHGGTIWTENISPWGARFSFELGLPRDAG
ncbi:ATP-binding protein [Caballeronia sp. LZ035]|uniref:GAF domain-containing sensor histidine kinase n=1 Tax=Caballeronia sp. LZ035 TaxID=3038568 RepID=UPI00285B1985|nr:ATP-binding protein [Caballeronia sp. LZ035]MDR5760852.1 ATP-binding protein [Caballeronia sp. LZ035]